MKVPKCWYSKFDHNVKLLNLISPLIKWNRFVADDNKILPEVYLISSI